MIIHISGAPGSGKTTIGQQIKDKLKNKIIVKDLDDLFREYNDNNKTKFNAKKYQKYIYKFIENNNNKPIIFVGLNKEHLTDTLYDIKPDYKFFIDLSVKINLERHFNREINGWLEWMINRDKQILFKQIEKNQNQIVNDLTNSLSRVLDISNQKKMINSYIKIYRKEKYIFLDYDTIYKKVLQIIKKLV